MRGAKDSPVQSNDDFTRMTKHNTIQHRVQTITWMNKLNTKDTAVQTTDTTDDAKQESK